MKTRRKKIEAHAGKINCTIMAEKIIIDVHSHHTNHVGRKMKQFLFFRESALLPSSIAHNKIQKK